MQMAMEKNPGIKNIFEDLRFPIQTEKSADLGNLSLPTIQSFVPSFRPKDEIVQGAIQLSGTPVFEEIIDIDVISSLEDSLKKNILEVAGL